MESKKFGRYEIREEIGRGGMATVYHAWDPRFEREVALKVLPREMLHDPQFRTRFEREAKTIAMLEHPAIVPVYDFGEEEGQPYFVMRFMAGGSLTNRMKNGPMTIQQVAHLFSRIAPALDEAHAKGIVHRDLKPGNILFDQYGEPYISDFGIAKIIATQANVTGSAILGTPAYMSPEQAQGEGIDGRSDIYGLGVIIFELLSGKKPYIGDTPMSVVIKQITEPVPHIRDINPDLPPAIEAITEKAMAKDRTDRFQTVKALSEALEGVGRGEAVDLEANNQTVVSSTKTVAAKRTPPEKKVMPVEQGEKPGPGLGSPAPGPRKKTGMFWIGLGGGALLLCVVVVGGFFLLRGKLPFLAARAATRTSMALNTETVVTPRPVKTDTPGVLPLPATDEPPTVTLAVTSSPSPSPTPTAYRPPPIGGADLIAFLNDNDIWVMGVDGTNLNQLTRDGGVKNDLQWAPDGQSLFYISGKCIQSVTLPGGEVIPITCFTEAKYLEAFEFSPDGTQVGISLNRVLYIVPFDLAAIKKAHQWTQLRDMKGCFTYNLDGTQAAPKSMRWSNDGTKIAVNTVGVDSGMRVDQVRIFNISKCSSTTPQYLSIFPSKLDMMTGYKANPSISSFDWNGEALFVLNSPYRYELGYLYAFNREANRIEKLLPMKTNCCFTAARFSPDGSFLLFAYQDITQNTGLQLYYISYGSIGTGTAYTPLPLPAGFLNRPGSHIDAALRPATP